MIRPGTYHSHIERPFLYGSFEMMALYSVSLKARMVRVETLPRLPLASVNAAIDSSSLASTTVTASYGPNVKWKLTILHPILVAALFAAASRDGACLMFLMPWSVYLSKPM